MPLFWNKQALTILPAPDKMKIKYTDVARGFLTQSLFYIF